MKIEMISTAQQSSDSGGSRAPRFNISSNNQVFVRLRSEAGEGVGYAYTFDFYSAQAVRSLIEGYAGLAFAGNDSTAFRRVRSELLRTRANFLGVRGLSRLALSALDIASWDLRCNELGTSLSAMLGIERERVPVYNAYRVWAGLPPEECARNAVEVAAMHGTPHTKMWIGGQDLAYDVERVAAVREALGPDAQLIVDAAQAYDARTAIEIANRLEPFNLLWFEDPCEYEDLAGLKAVAENSAVPLGTGEHVYGLDNLKQLLDTGAIWIAVLDLERIGGITDFLATAAVCNAYRVAVGTHVYSHIGPQVLAGVTGPTWCEYSPLWDVFFGKPTIVDGEVLVDDLVGVGPRLLPDLDLDWRDVDTGGD